MKHTQYLIVGAGPAGLQLAYYLERYGYDYTVLEAKDTAGAFFSEHPRHRSLLSLNKRFNGFEEREFNMRHDWNSLLTEDEDPLFGEYSADLYPKADDLCRYMVDFAARHRLKIQYQSPVTLIDRSDTGEFLVTTSAGKYSCNQLIMATGACAPFLPSEIEGIECAPGYEDHVLDPAHYQNKSVLVIGRGNSAFEVANHLAAEASIIHVAIGNRPIQMAWETHSVRHLRAVNNTIVEMFHVKALHGALGLSVRKVEKSASGGFDVVADEEVPNWKVPGVLELKLHYDHVIRCTGFKYVTPEIFSPAVRPQECPKSKYPVLDESWQSSTPDLYYIGTAMAARDKQSASSFIHGFRYNVRSLFHLLQHKYHQKPFVSEQLPLQDAEQLGRLADLMLTRLSTTAGLYQQFSILCDVIKFEPGNCRIIRELPRDYVFSNPEFSQGDVLLVDFEYGFQRYPKDINPLHFITQMDEHTSRRCAAFLQPVFRHYRDGKLINEDNLGDSLTLRYSAHRQMKATSEPSPSDDVERNVVMNIINRISRTTDEVFAETSLLKNHAFRPWPEGKIPASDMLPRCMVNMNDAESAAE